MTFVSLVYLLLAICTDFYHYTCLLLFLFLHHLPFGKKHQTLSFTTLPFNLPTLTSPPTPRPWL